MARTNENSKPNIALQIKKNAITCYCVFFKDICLLGYFDF